VVIGVGGRLFLRLVFLGVVFGLTPVPVVTGLIGPSTVSSLVIWACKSFSISTRLAIFVLIPFDELWMQERGVLVPLEEGS
jgi:hypothetical protein